MFTSTRRDKNATGPDHQSFNNHIGHLPRKRMSTSTRDNNATVPDHQPINHIGHLTIQEAVCSQAQEETAMQQFQTTSPSTTLALLLLKRMFTSTRRDNNATVPDHLFFNHIGPLTTQEDVHKYKKRQQCNSSKSPVLQQPHKPSYYSRGCSRAQEETTMQQFQTTSPATT